MSVCNRSHRAFGVYYSAKWCLENSLGVASLLIPDYAVQTFLDCCVDDEGLYVQPIARVESGDISAVGSS